MVHYVELHVTGFTPPSHPSLTHWVTFSKCPLLQQLQSMEHVPGMGEDLLIVLAVKSSQ